MLIDGNDSYKTISTSSTGLYKDKGSKFISFAYPVRDEEEISELLAKLRKQHHNAHHHCYAWVLGFNKERYKINDDGEPSGTAGKPIYGQMLSHDLCNVLIIVVRYFGGTKLGVRGLINAYKGAAIDAIENNTIVTKTIRNHYRIFFEYLAMNDVMQIMKEYDLPQHDHQFDLNCELSYSVRKNKAEEVVSKLEKIRDLRVEFLHSE